MTFGCLGKFKFNKIFTCHSFVISHLVHKPPLQSTNTTRPSYCVKLDNKIVCCSHNIFWETHIVIRFPTAHLSKNSLSHEFRLLVANFNPVSQTVILNYCSCTRITVLSSSFETSQKKKLVKYISAHIPVGLNFILL